MLDSPPEISSVRHGPPSNSSGSASPSHRSTGAAGSPGRSSAIAACPARRPLRDRHAMHLGRPVVDAEGPHVGVDPPDHHLLGGAESAAQLYGAVHDPA